MWAAYRGHTGIVGMLLEHNADIHANGNFHLGPLLWSAGNIFFYLFTYKFVAS